MKSELQQIISLGHLTLGLGEVSRITYHPDGETPESVTTHTVMLATLATAFAARELTDLDLGLVCEFALVHDLVEALVGDTPTLTDYDPVAKRKREEEAVDQICAEFHEFGWLTHRIREYEHQILPEARYVRAFDKCLPKVTHVLNYGATFSREGVSYIALRDRLEEQYADIVAYAGEFRPLIELYEQLAAEVLDILDTR